MKSGVFMAVMSIGVIVSIVQAAPTAKQLAAARVAVAMAQVQVADELPALPDKPPRIIRSEPVRLEIAETTMVDNVYPLTVTAYTGEKLYGVGWCKTCNRLKPLWGNGNERIIINWSTDAVPEGGDAAYPAFRFEGISGYSMPADESGRYKLPSSLDELADIVERNTHPQTSQGANQVAGTIHASSSIRSSLAWWRTNIGEGVKVEAGWDRTGAQTFPLLAKGDWSYQAVCGNFGRFRFSAPGSNLPVKTSEVTYAVEDGWPVIKSIGPVPLRPLLEGFNAEQGYSSDGPAAIGPAAILSVLSVFRDLWSLLHPTCDLQLGGNVSASAVLDGDVLAIDFQQCPSVRIVALFTFQLSVQRVEIREESVRVVFGGSRLIKERTFKVE